MEASSPHVVVVIDDDERVREALAALFSAVEFDARFFASATAYIESPRLSCPACLVVDVGLADMNGLELQEQIAGLHHPPIIFITGRGDIPSSVRAMKAGAIDFLTKPFSETELLSAVTSAIEIDRLEHSARAGRKLLEDRVATLTKREKEVMDLVVSGLLNKQAAAQLGISDLTLQIHRGKVMKKMRAASLAELVRMAESLKPPQRPGRV